MSEIIPVRAHLMQRVSDHVRNGYRFWCSGTVSTSRAISWAEKAEKLYDTRADRNRRARAKARGFGSAYLFFYLLDRRERTRIGWILLVSDGKHLAHDLERGNLRRAEHDPPHLWDYLLVRETRAGRPEPVWTWRLSRNAYEAWRLRIVDTARRGSERDVRQTAQSLNAIPGFGGIRNQLKALQRLIRYEWARVHGNHSRAPQGLRLWRVRRMAIKAVPLRDALRELARNSQAVPEWPSALAAAPTGRTRDLDLEK